MVFEPSAGKHWLSYLGKVFNFSFLWQCNWLNLKLLRRWSITVMNLSISILLSAIFGQSCSGNTSTCILPWYPRYKLKYRIQNKITKQIQVKGVTVSVNHELLLALTKSKVVILSIKSEKLCNRYRYLNYKNWKWNHLTLPLKLKSTSNHMT